MKTGLTAIAFCLTFCCMPQPSVAQTVPDTLYGIIKPETRLHFLARNAKDYREKRKRDANDTWTNMAIPTFPHGTGLTVWITCTTRL